MAASGIIIFSRQKNYKLFVCIFSIFMAGRI